MPGGVGTTVLCVAFTGGYHTGTVDPHVHRTCRLPGSRPPRPLSPFCTFQSPARSPRLALVPPCPFPASQFLEKPGLSVTWEAFGPVSLITFSLYRTTANTFSIMLNLEAQLKGTRRRKGLREVTPLARGRFLAWNPCPENPSFLLIFPVDYFGCTDPIRLPKGRSLRAQITGLSLRVTCW